MLHHQALYVGRCVVLAVALPMCLLGADFAVSGGGGGSFGDDQRSVGVTAFGVSLGGPHVSKHRVQFDYSIHNAHFSSIERRQFFTASYVIQAQTGKTRPFFQAGGGIVHRRDEVQVFIPPDAITTRTETDTSFAAVFGGGATIDIGKSFFIRPEVRVYGHVGPTLTVLPTISVGWRF